MNRFRRLLLSRATLIVLGLINFSTFASAGRFDNWCLPANDCVGEPSPIVDNLFNTCEENCQLKNEVPVKGMSAFIYDVKCTADGMEPSIYRTIIQKRKDSNGRTRVIIIDENGITELERCK